MKTQKGILLNALAKAMVLGVLLLAVSCNNNTDSKKGTASTKKGEQPKIDIHTAVLTNNLEALKQHIAAGSNLNEKDPIGGSSPLITAALFDKPEMAKALLDAGADMNFQNNDGSTALHTAAFFCRPAIVKMLLEKGADKSIKNKYNQTAYETVAAPFATVKGTYEALGKILEPMGLKLDFAYLEKTRPEVATLLK
jgi:hypothetical protein